MSVKANPSKKTVFSNSSDQMSCSSTSKRELLNQLNKLRQERKEAEEKALKARIQSDLLSHNKEKLLNKAKIDLNKQRRLSYFKEKSIEFKKQVLEKRQDNLSMENVRFEKINNLKSERKQYIKVKKLEREKQIQELFETVRSDLNSIKTKLLINKSIENEEKAKKIARIKSAYEESKKKYITNNYLLTEEKNNMAKDELMSKIDREIKLKKMYESAANEVTKILPMKEQELELLKSENYGDLINEDIHSKNNENLSHRTKKNDNNHSSSLLFEKISQLSQPKRLNVKIETEKQNKKSDLSDLQVNKFKSKKMLSQKNIKVKQMSSGKMDYHPIKPILPNKKTVTNQNNKLTDKKVNMNSKSLNKMIKS